MIYIQSDSERTRPHHFDAACAMFGAIESMQDYRLTTFEEVQSGKFDQLIRINLFVGSVEFMQEVFKRIDRMPKPIMNSNRPTSTMTLKEVREGVKAGNEYFVKPFQQKLFTGLVIDQYTISSLREFPDDLSVMVCAVIKNILSEWRVYIMYGQIVDSRNYSGDFKISPNYSVVQSMLNEHKVSLPVAFTMDVGVAENGGPLIGNLYDYTFIVEFNDAWSIGNYGIENMRYLRLLKERYYEIMKS